MKYIYKFILILINFTFIATQLSCFPATRDSTFDPKNTPVIWHFEWDDFNFNTPPQNIYGDGYYSVDGICNTTPSVYYLGEAILPDQGRSIRMGGTNTQIEFSEDPFPLYGTGDGFSIVMVLRQFYPAVSGLIISKANSTGQKHLALPATSPVPACYCPGSFHAAPNARA